MRAFIFSFLIAILAGNNSVYSQVITTFAGNGLPGYTGDGNPATSSRLNMPQDVAVDTAGNIYIAALSDNAIRKVDRYGIMSTVAGSGPVGGFSGDGGPAVSAKLDGPASIAIDKVGNIYVADLHNARIRKINTAGIITTIAGTGVAGYSGDGGPATAAQLNLPYGIAVDTTGNIYIADELNNRIRKIDVAGNISTFAGTGTPGFSGDGGPAATAQIHYPVAVTVDKSGNVLIVDYHNNCVRMVTPSGIISTIAGIGPDGDTGDGGPATAAKLSSPSGIETDALGNIYIADGGNSIIRKVNALGIISTIAGNRTDGYGGDGGLAIDATLLGPCGICIDPAGNLYIADFHNQRVRKVSGISGALNVCYGSTTTLHNDFPDGSWLSSVPAIATIDATTGVVTGVSTGSATIYYVIGTDTAFSPMVVVDTLPGIAPIAGPSIVCVGSPSTFSDAIPGGIWSTANATVSMAANVATGIGVGTNTITYTNTNACGIATATMAVTVNSASADVIMGGGTCLGDTTILLDTVSGGIWGHTNPSVATMLGGGIFTGIAAGTDTVWYSVSHLGCFDTAFYTLYILPPTTAGTISGPSAVCTGSTISLTTTVPGGTWSATNGNAAIASGVISGITAGIDTIVYTVTGPCGAAMDSFVVTVNTASAGTITGIDSICTGATATLYDTASGGTWFSVHPAIATVSSAGVVTTITAGVDTMAYSVSHLGCHDTAFFPVRVLPTPDAGLISGTPSLCTGATVSLTSTVPGGTWTVVTGNVAVTGGVITGITAGIDTVIYTNTNSCGTASASFIVTVHEAVAGLISGASSLCIGDATTLSASVPGGAWSVSDPSIASVNSAGVVSGFASGNDTITYVVSSFGCTASTNFTITVKSLVECADGITMENENSALALYPNPCTDYFTVEVPGAPTNTTCTLYDMPGKVIGSQQANQLGKAVFNVGNLPQGIYLLKVQNGSHIQTQKVIVR